MEPAVGESPNGGAGGWELRWVHRYLQLLRIYRIKYTEWAISIRRTARQADKDSLRINDAIILHVFPPLAVRSTISGDIFSMPRLVMLRGMTLTSSTDFPTFLLPKRIKWLVQERYDAALIDLDIWDHNLISCGNERCSLFDTDANFRAEGVLCRKRIQIEQC